MGAWNLGVLGGVTVEARDGVTGWPTGWFCPFGTTECGIGVWAGCWGCGEVVAGCIRPGCYPGLELCCPSGTGWLVVGHGGWTLGGAGGWGRRLGLKNG